MLISATGKKKTPLSRTLSSSQLEEEARPEKEVHWIGIFSNIVGTPREKSPRTITFYSMKGLPYLKKDIQI